MPSLNDNKKVHCGDCGNMYSCQNAARHRKSCQTGIISCPDFKYCLYFQQEMIYHGNMKHAPSTPSTRTGSETTETK